MRSPSRRPLVAVAVVALLIGVVATAVSAAPPLPTLAITDVRAAEGNAGSTAFVFTVSAAGSIRGSVTVTFATANGTAAAGSDYTSASGILSFTKSAKSRTVTVQVAGDTTVESDETFQVRLSGAIGATLADATGVGTIVNDDALVADPTIAAAGDIACSPTDANVAGGNLAYCQQMATSNLVFGQNYAGVLLLGDNQYENGTTADYNAVYGPSWGRFLATTHPAPGNHEYNTAGAAGYYSYFGSSAGNPATGYYSYDIGSWHLIALNSNCSFVACAAGSAQEVWLRADLAAHASTACTLAYWHHPRFSSGSSHGSSSATQALWAALDQYGAELVLTGHEHNYERFAPQTSTGTASATGVREFVVGTGGKNHYGFSTAIANSQVHDATSFGILSLTLHNGSYDWNFVRATGTFTDSGSATCH